MSAAIEARPKAPGVAYSALAVVLLLIVVTVALTARQPAPPTIAEFAPQAQQEIKQAPQNLASNFGSAHGQCGATGPCSGNATTTTAAGPVTTIAALPPPPVVRVPRVHQCYGDPPRQTLDPQSPPCVPYWEGNNGGATYKGVTGDTINIASPLYDSVASPAIQAYLNTNFEFYGRTVKLISTPTTGGTGTAAQQQADAAAADEQFHVFGSTIYSGSGGYPFYQEMVRRKLVSVTNDPLLSTAQLAAWAPYMWQYPMATDQEFAAMGAEACAQLVGHDAVHAGDPGGQLQKKVRKFGVVIESYFGAPVSPQPLVSALAGCNAAPLVKTAAAPQTADASQSASDAQNIMLQMNRAGVTSVFCLCDVFLGTGGFATAATREGYYPEWVLGSYFDNDISGMKALVPADQIKDAFGTTTVPREWPLADDPSFWVEAAETNPGQRPVNDQEETQRYTWQRLYRSALLMASGIQMAGPDLTPQTFAAGLHRAVFPNPDTPPLVEGKVGFNDGGYTMVHDLNEWYWGPGASGQDPAEGPGAMCYVNGGQRYAPTAWSSGDPFFPTNRPCSSGGTSPPGGT